MTPEEALNNCEAVLSDEEYKTLAWAVRELPLKKQVTKEFDELAEIMPGFDTLDKEIAWAIKVILAGFEFIKDNLDVLNTWSNLEKSSFKSLSNEVKFQMTILLKDV